MTTPSTFTVMMHPTLVDQLDHCFSPMDGIQAIGEIFEELPILHRPRRGWWPGFLKRRCTPLFRGRFDWYDLGFSYIQIGEMLHVIELWPVDATEQRSHHHGVDCVLGTTGRPYIQQVDVDDEPSGRWTDEGGKNQKLAPSPIDNKEIPS